MNFTKWHGLGLGVAVIASGGAGLALVMQPTSPGVTIDPRLRADAALLESHVRRLSEETAPRDYAHPENLRKVADDVVHAWEAYGLEVEEQAYEVDGRTFWNLSTRIGSAAPKKVFVAHYDAADELPGADDNASGVAGLLELGRIFAAQPPSGGVELAMVSTEEPPYFRTEGMGSAHHAEQLFASEREIRWVVSVEMIGYFSDEPGSQHFPLPGMNWIYPDQGNFIAIVGDLGAMGAVRDVKAGMLAQNELPVWSINAPTLLQGVDWSDHLNYRNRGFAAVMVTDTSFLRNLNYHTPADTADRLDYRRMALVVDALAQVAWQPE